MSIVTLTELIKINHFNDNDRGLQPLGQIKSVTQNEPVEYTEQVGNIDELKYENEATFVNKKEECKNYAK